MAFTPLTVAVGLPVLLSALSGANDNVLSKGGDHVMPMYSPADSVKLEQIKSDQQVLLGLWQAAAERNAERTLEQL